VQSRMANRNLELLTSVARLLRPMLEELVFVGGCTTTLLITDPAAAEVRPTYDVDSIASITSYAEYKAFSKRLRQLGFAEDQSYGAPICRWAHGKIRLDVMPTDERILGFSNRWYKPAMEKPQRIQLDNDLIIRVVTTPLFLGTKLEAFKGRGKNDFFASHDLEDVISVIDGRSSLLDEIQHAPKELRLYLAYEVHKLITNPEFADALPGYLLPDSASQARLHPLLQTLRAIASLLSKE
jgi:predicted nucleotidyltransferase